MELKNIKLTNNRLWEYLSLQTWSNEFILYFIYCRSKTQLQDCCNEARLITKNFRAPTTLWELKSNMKIITNNSKKYFLLLRMIQRNIFKIRRETFRFEPLLFLPVIGQFQLTAIGTQIGIKRSEFKFRPGLLYLFRTNDLRKGIYPCLPSPRYGLNNRKMGFLGLRAKRSKRRNLLNSN